MRLATALLGLMLVLLASPVLAGPPLDGDYKSLDGEVELGRFSESWAGGGQGQIGNTVHAQSWDGMVLGGEWWVACPMAAEAPEVIADNVDPITGLGTIEYRTVYSGGHFWLSGAGPWGNGDVEYTGMLEYYTHHTTFIVVNFQPIAYTTNADFAGYFDTYCKCILVLANAASAGNGPQPPQYPVFLEYAPVCGENPGLLGEWGDVEDITISIFECASGNEASTWGGIKTLYR